MKSHRLQITIDQSELLSKRGRNAVRSGFSLLEVMLAIAILGGALVVIGQLIRIGSQSAAFARDQTTAQIYCESKLNEVAAGLVQPQSTGPATLETDPDWQYFIEVGQTNQDGLLSVMVKVEQDPSTHSRPITFSLTRWMIDPTKVPVSTSTTGTGSATGTTSSSPTGSAAGGS
jgi:general secretion pathway protein I